MVATASQWPPPGDAVSAIRDPSFPKRTKRPTGDDERVAAINFARCVFRQISAERTVLAADRQTPARGAISSRDFLDGPDEGHRIRFLAAQRTWDP